MRPVRGVGAIAAMGAAALLLPAAPLGAQGESVTVERRVLMTPDLTPADARRRAIGEALAEAARRVAGVRVQASALSTVREDGRGVASGYASAILLDAAARATDYRVDDEAWETLRPAEGEAQLYLRLRLTATVEREVGDPDPAFTADLSLNAARFELRGRATVAGPGGDELIATVRTSHPAHLTLFVIIDDSAERLFPNEYLPAIVARAAEAMELPDPEWRERGLHLRPSLPAGRASRREILMLVATRQAPPRPPQRATVVELQRWLLSIPRPTRTIAFAPYETVRRE